jgi:16S rRNA processing protein RimM
LRSTSGETSSKQTERWVAIARILRPRGNKGEVAAELLTEFPERLAKISQVYLSDGKSEPRPIGLASFWMDRNHPGQAVFHFESCRSISEAEKFRGLDVLLPIEQRVVLPAGQYFVSDLIGCSVFELLAEDPKAPASSPCSLASAPVLLGTVSDVQFTGEGVAGTPLLAIDTQRGEILIPLAQQICTSIDTTARRIEVRLPDGLRDLNDAQ